MRRCDCHVLVLQHPPCSLRAVKMMVPDSSPTMHSATLRGVPLGPLALVRTTFASITWQGQTLVSTWQRIQLPSAK